MNETHFFDLKPGVFFKLHRGKNQTVYMKVLEEGDPSFPLYNAVSVGCCGVYRTYYIMERSLVFRVEAIFV